MRASFLLVQEAGIGLVACALIAGWVGITGNPVPVAAGIFLAFLLLYPVGLWAGTNAEPTSGELQRIHNSRHPFRVTRLWWLLIAFHGLFALFSIVSNAVWTLVPLLLVSYAAFALSLAAGRRERQQLREALARPELTGPKVIGIRSPEQVPPGWSPVLVHRIDRGRFDMLVDYRILVDGDRVGTLGPGQTLVLGLPPGPHRIQGGLGRLTNTPVPFTPEPGAAVHFTVEPASPDRRANADRRSRPGEYFRLVRVPPW
ncbi:hypothetical protein [Nocardiopsis sp. HUAS JQ3]|uniref:hypothetical protein n=1 Tax=Nocardiopsis sp. HUAS JQ3 TaxID=3061629 RepID=UPI0023A9D870|nr:hypothetical protein [Nocardiopsis sp. HUAS JQ3]WDZ89001.1 hypothetical protein PV789_18790 [Nocardiopsis sp. HUAS JQ3]